MKILTVSTVATLALATAAFAEGRAQGGKSKGKGPSTDFSAGGGFEKGGASVARGLKGGWGGNALATNGQTSSGPTAAPREE